jgi:hypothetical protein
LGVADDGEDGADFGGLVFGDADLEEVPAAGEGISVSTLSVETSTMRLVGLDGVADGLQPAGDGAFGDGFAERGERDLGACCGSLR